MGKKASSAGMYVRKSCYAVSAGRNLGITRTWNECSAAVQRFKGNAYKGFIRNGTKEQLGNFDLKLPRDRFEDRYQLLGELDDLKRHLDQSGEVNGMSQIERQTYDLLLRGISDAFDLSKEDPKTIAKYDTSHLFNMSDYHNGGKYFLFNGKKKLVDKNAGPIC